MESRSVSLPNEKFTVKYLLNPANLESIRTTLSQNPTYANEGMYYWVNNWQPLHYACAESQVDLAKLLIKFDAKVHAPVPTYTISLNKVTPFQLACYSHNIEMMRMLWSTNEVPDTDWYIALKNLINRNRYLELYKEVRIGLRQSSVSEPQWEKTHLAINQQDYMAVIQTLVEFNPAWFHRYQEELLHEAILLGSSNIVRFLLTKAQNLDLDRKFSGYTLIDIILLNDKFTTEDNVILQLLIDAGGKLPMDNLGIFPLSFLKSELAKNITLINSPNEAGLTPLMQAILSNSHNINVTYLLEQKANIHVKVANKDSKHYGKTAFDLAVEVNNTMAIKQLLNKGATVIAGPNYQRFLIGNPINPIVDFDNHLIVRCIDSKLKDELLNLIGEKKLTPAQKEYFEHLVSTLGDSIDNTNAIKLLEPLKKLLYFMRDLQDHSRRHKLTTFCFATGDLMPAAVTLFLAVTGYKEKNEVSDYYNAYQHGKLQKIKNKFIEYGFLETEDFRPKQCHI